MKERKNWNQAGEKLTVIGVAADAEQRDWASEPDPEVYRAALQNREFLGAEGPHIAYITLVIRVSGNASIAAGDSREVVNDIFLADVFVDSAELDLLET